MRALIAILLLFTSLCQAQGLGAPGAGKTALGGFGQTQEFLPVEEAYQLAVDITDDSSLRLYWQVAPEYYLYQHRFKFALSDDAGDLAATPELPPALEREDEYFGLVKVYYDNADITLRTDRPLQGEAQLQVTSQGCADAGLCYPPRKEYFSLDLASGTVTPLASAPGKTPPGPTTGGDSEGNWAYMLLLAFIGGAILNLMPCVFPVLSLKVLSFARSSDHDRHLQSWVYTAGVITSFVAVAALLISLQAAGRAIGWGFQLQSPGFVIALAYLFLAMGLSLSGLVEFGGSLMNTGAGLADKRGLSGSFFTGVLAVVVASPCTAPFMGTALGFAVTQPPLIGLSVFAALGAGMAAPLLLFGYSGAARALMPKPGAWMETLKQLLAFPLYATAIWLLWVAGRQTGVNTMTAALGGALVLAFGLWLWSLGGWRRGAALACLVLAAGLGSWRGLDATTREDVVLADGRVPWSTQALAQLREDGKPVFVDVTADWCITCLANEAAVLFTDEIQQAFEDHGVVYMVADWTNYDPEIARFIGEHNRTGIPLYLMYPANPAESPLVLPQLLTNDTVLEALRAVSTKEREVAGIFAKDEH